MTSLTYSLRLRFFRFLFSMSSRKLKQIKKEDADRTLLTHPLYSLRLSINPDLSIRRGR